MDLSKFHPEGHPDSMTVEKMLEAKRRLEEIGPLLTKIEAGPGTIARVRDAFRREFGEDKPLSGDIIGIGYDGIHSLGSVSLVESDEPLLQSGGVIRLHYSDGSKKIKILNL